jgi:excisionase family DNA binding protein
MDIDETIHMAGKKNLKKSSTVGGIEKERFLRLDDVAAHLLLSVRTVERLCHEGKLPYNKVNRSVRISEEDLKKYEDSVHRGGTT